jgi:predicted metal-dependent hydrolase
MQDFTTFFFILICASVFYVYLENKASDVTYVSLNNIEFLVRNLPDKEEAALLLSKIRERLTNIVEHSCKKMIEDKKEEKKLDETKKIRNDSLKRLKKNFRPNNITESSPGNKYTSYSINKGDKIVFCLRSKDGNNKLVDINTMMFVAIHELAHLMTKSIGHTTEFWDNMRFLLKEGIEIGVYVKQDFNSIPVDYCGTKITDTPLNN